MKTIKTFQVILATLMIGLLSSPLFAANEGRIKSLLQEGLKLYSDRQYVRALDLFKQVQTLDPSNSTADEYIKSTKQRILEWELHGSDQPEKSAVNWDTLAPTGVGMDTSANAKDIIAARRSLVERMKNRSTNTDAIVQIEESARGVSVTLFQDQLFVPGLTTLRDEALPILQQVADIIKTGIDRSISIRTAIYQDGQDAALLYPEFALPSRDPNDRFNKQNAVTAFQDLEATRSLILFTHLAQRAMIDNSRVVIE